MNPTVGKLVYWTPRVICLLFACFISIFALDVFGEGYSFGQLLVALAMHLIPTALVLLALLVAWRWEWVGTVLFTALGAAYIILAWGRFPIGSLLLIAGPCFLLGVLFLLGWLYRKEIRAPRAA